MHFTIAYLTVTGGPRTDFFASRFASTFRKFTPGMPFELVVICNGGPPREGFSSLFGDLHGEYVVRENVGGDIGAYIDLAKRMAPNCNGDHCLLCLGESVYFWREGWLRRLAEAWVQSGPGMYGFYASKLVSKHLNTTAFAVDPRLLANYPEHVKTKEQRYQFEHGTFPFWRRIEAQGRPVKLIHWDNIQDPWQWRSTNNEFWRGDQTQCLMWCNHTERFANATKATKTRWQNNADRGLVV